MADPVGFLGVSALVIMTPGQDTALTIRNVVLGGRLGGIYTTLGVCLGQATWALLVALGVGAIFIASQPAYAALRFVGSAYLVLLGVRGLLEAWRPGTGHNQLDVDRDRVRLTPAAAMRQGLVSNLVNPKMLAFFGSLLPQFASSSSELLIHGLVFSGLTMLWLTGYALAIARIGAVFNSSTVRRALAGLTGAVLVAVGIQLLASDPG